MPRNRRDRRDRYEDDEDDEPRKSGISGVALGVIIGGSVLLLVVVAVCGGLLWFGALGARQAEQQQKKQEATLPTRDEFRTKIMGKTADEVIALIGKPDTTQDHGGGDQNWYYDHVSRDPVNGKTDTSVQVIFENGRVVKVNF
jgi:outer membrane protein assembly factor BamE (lipoprotein component of BamABCDE complex)